MRSESYPPRICAVSAMAPDAALPPAPAGLVPLGAAAADDWLGGGLKGDGLHEAYAAADDGTAAAAFLLLLASRKFRDDRRSVLWVRAGGSGAAPYGPGVAELGIDPDAITLLLLPDGKAVLRAALDGVRDGAASTVLIELAGRQKLLDLTASRRLALAAADTGTMALVARSGAEPMPSAAHTRWQVASAPSRAADAATDALGLPGAPAFALTLLRRRGGRDGLDIIMEWDRDAASFRDARERAAAAPLPRALPALAGGGATGGRAARAA